MIYFESGLVVLGAMFIVDVVWSIASVGLVEAARMLRHVGRLSNFATTAPKQSWTKTLGFGAMSILLWPFVVAAWMDIMWGGTTLFLRSYRRRVADLSSM